MKGLDFDDVNIFFTHLNPTIAAEFCCDAHVRKMVVESTQMLANVYHLDNAKHAPPPKADGKPYAKSHWNHPCAIWARADFKQWDWLRMHAYGLATEFKIRFGNEHACWKALTYMTAHIPTPWMPNRHFECPPLAMPDEFTPNRYAGMSKLAVTPIGAYRRYIREGKKHLHTWTTRNPPLWLIDNERVLSNMANGLLNACDLTCWGADNYRAELAPGMNDDQWGEIKEIADAIANGTDADGTTPPEQAEVASILFDRCPLVLLGADDHRKIAVTGLEREPSKAEWQLIVWLATERANGRDPLERPADWDFTNYRG